MTRVRLGDLLVRAKMVTVEQVAAALAAQARTGGRLGDHLVQAGAVKQEALDAFLHRMPLEPADLAAMGIEVGSLLELLVKLMYTHRLESVRQFVESMKLPSQVVIELARMAVERKLIFTRGLRSSDNPLDMCYSFTEEGRRFALDALDRSRYAGPAPVTLAEFNDQVNLQKLTNELVTLDRIRNALSGMSFDDSFFEKVGPALNAGRAMLLYGPPGNGKSSVANRLASVFEDVIYIPHGVLVDGQVIAMFDPSVHVPVSPVIAGEQRGLSLIKPEAYDPRWVPCRRPFVMAGGELSMEMLELRYDDAAHAYEAPLHMKALGGCFLIDDFGRQLISPAKLLNRWIVPLESRVDFLKLHTGKSFSIPFDELVIFSTNLEPEDLMDPAFLRRLPYKIEIGAPGVETFRSIFAQECAIRGLTLPSAFLDLAMRKIAGEKGMDLACYQPKFLLDQIAASCRFMGLPLSLEQRFLEYAVDNLR